MTDVVRSLGKSSKVPLLMQSALVCGHGVSLAKENSLVCRTEEVLTYEVK